MLPCTPAPSLGIGTLPLFPASKIAMQELPRPVNHKRPGPYLTTEILEPSRQHLDLAATQLSPPYDFTFPEKDPGPFGLSSGLQTCDESQLVPIPVKRRKLDSQTSMPQGLGSPGHQEEKLGKPDSSNQHSDSQASVLSYWSDAGSSSSHAMALPFAKHITNLSPFWCVCAGFKQSDGYCPLSQASPAVYDPNDPQPYGSEKQQYMHMPSQSEPQDLSLIGSEQFNPGTSEPETQSMSMAGYLDQGRMQLASPPDRAKDSLFSQGRLPLEHFTDEYMPQDIASSHMPYPQCYGPNVGQERMNAVADFSEAFGRPTIALRGSVGGCSVAAPFDMLSSAGGSLGESGPLNGWSDACDGHTSSSFDVLLPDQRGGKRGPFKDPKLREQTAQTRRTGSCIRCRMQRIRCESDPEDPGGICLTCTHLATTKAGRFPCLRYKITDMKLYKPGQVPGYEWTRRWDHSITETIQNWASPDVKFIAVSAGYSTKCIELQVRRFIPQDGDKLVRTWDHNGTKKSVEIPPYALVDFELTKSTYTAHIEDIMTDTIQHVLKSSGDLLERTYFEAVRLMRHPETPEDSAKLLRRTLTLWVSIRLSTTSGFLVGRETLGMSGSILDETSPNAGMIPMPPVLGAQLDLVLIHHIQTKLRRDMLETLQKMVLKNKQATWLVIYLVTFILLHNASLITAHDAGYARKHGMKSFAAAPLRTRRQSARIPSGSKYPARTFPLLQQGRVSVLGRMQGKDLRSLADLGEDELMFVHATKDYHKMNRVEWQQIRNGGVYEDDFFFVSQLFEENWKPQSTI
ncbi:hypothetical protein L249_6860 [Ophiocordyceps polyrhachis-furcata BCC 54312]|uniref:Zn(2)-C6 fungal-type domain-containing protein n=1 Tax=Ophiocordyceps polyrhachis-furcata BCC 54312 TaxID=1330021 RepID=A0A367LKT6_9HYPO|nr:hypothetical protein L249_6860 [Ophiocordyceps polyrhachis-furcata BCC 54312]